MKSPRLTRRAFVARSTAAVAGSVLAGRFVQAEGSTGPYQAMGTRAGEVTDTTAIVWTRLTAAPTRNNSGAVVPPLAKRRPGQASELPAPVDQLEGACPGAPGRVQLRYGTREDLSDARTTNIATAAAENDFICEFNLAGLKPGTIYHYASEISGAPAQSAFRGRFETAPAPDAATDVRFCVMTCQGYPDRGHPDGHSIYPAMQAFQPQFTCLTGDLVYYHSPYLRMTTSDCDGQPTK